MTTNLKFGGEYLIQDQDHMSEIRPTNGVTTPTVTRAAHRASASEQRSNRHQAPTRKGKTSFASVN